MLSLSGDPSRLVLGALVHLLQDLCMLATVLAFFVYCIIVLAIAIQPVLVLRACHNLLTRRDIELLV